LNAFRGLLPPLGQIDLSPILAFTVLNVFQSAATALPAQQRRGDSAARGVRLPRLPLLAWRDKARK
jgi:YggT family protein